MLWALLGSLGVGAIAFLIQTIRLSQTQTKLAKQTARAEKAEAKIPELEKATEAAKVETADNRARYEKIDADIDAEIKRLQDLLATCQDPKVIHERLTGLGKIVKIV
jgi:uncharacterized protein YoxC